MPYAPIIPLIMGAGLGPSTTRARFSEVTQGKVKEGGKRGESRIAREVEIDFTCFPVLHVSPPNQQQPPLRRASPLLF